MNHFLQNSNRTARMGRFLSVVGLSLACALALAPPAQAAPTTNCVDQNGKPGCFSSIAEAVAAAASGATITVGPGTYHEDIVIKKSLTLAGADPLTTIIDATGLSNGIYVDGFDAAGLTTVIVNGFTVRNANFEGILVTDASAVTIWGNIVRENDRALQPSIAECPGEPVFETAEGVDCGEGIHFIGVVHSTIADNLVALNAGGILISDETTTSHDNVITRNLVVDNSYQGGITLGSHPAYQKPGASQPTLAFGLYNNMVSENDSVHNGFGTPSAGAGVMISAPGAGNRAYANQIVANRLIGNAMAGVAVHNLVVVSTTGNSNNPDVSRNSIVNNYIAGNGADAVASTTVPTGIAVLGVSPIVDLLISNNFIEDEGIDVAFNSASTLEMHLNDLGGHQSHIGIANLNAAGAVDGKDNWWGCATGPGTIGCGTISGAGAGSVAFSPWLMRPMDGLLGHGLDLFLDHLHRWDFDCDSGHDFDHDFDLGRFFGPGR